MRTSILVLTLLCLSTGCASNRVKQIDTEIDVKGTTSSGQLGLRDNVAIIQKETRADDELRLVQWNNNRQEDELGREYFDLKSCRNDMADPRLGGSGEVVQLPEIDNMKQPSEIKEQFGLNSSQNLVFVTREDFLKRVAIERSYQDTLTRMVKLVKQTREDCERKMGYARLKAGLPAKRIQGRALVNQSGTIEQVVQRHENSLDDAFAMQPERKPATKVEE